MQLCCAVAGNGNVQLIERIGDLLAVIVAALPGARPDQLGAVQEEGAVVGFGLDAVAFLGIVDIGVQFAVADRYIEFGSGQQFGVKRTVFRADVDF